MRNRNIRTNRNPRTDAIPAPEAADPARLYRPREVLELLGISRRQLQYWARTGLVEPSSSTPGGHHRYAFADLVALRTTRRLIDAGVSLQRIRRSIAALRERLPQVERPLSELVLVATGDVVLVFGQETAFEAVSGQEWVFEVSELRQEIEAWERAAGARGVHRRARPARRDREQRQTA